MASSASGGRKQGAAWGALLKAHSAEKERTERNSSPLIPNEQSLSTINTKISSSSPRADSSHLPEPLQKESNLDPNVKFRFGALHAALEEEEGDWVHDGSESFDSSPIPSTMDVLSEHIPSDDSNQHQLQSESNHLAAIVAEPLSNQNWTGTSASISPTPEHNESGENAGKYVDWAAWKLEQLGSTLHSIKQNTDSSPPDRNSFAHLLTDKVEMLSTEAKPTSLNLPEQTNSNFINKLETMTNSISQDESSQPEKPKKSKQKKKNDKQKETAPSSTTPVEVVLQVPPPLPVEFRAFNLPPPFLSSTSHDSNHSRPASPSANASLTTQAAAAASNASIAKTTRDKPKSTASSERPSGSTVTTTYNIAPFRVKKLAPVEKPSPQDAKPKDKSRPAAPPAFRLPPSSSTPPPGAFTSDPMPQFDRITFPALMGQSSDWYSFPVAPQSTESGIAALNAIQEREAENVVRNFEDWCRRALADLHISSDSEVAADELHTLDSEERVFLHVCLLVGQAKASLADEFSNSYLRNRMRIDLPRLRRRAEERMQQRVARIAAAAASSSRSPYNPFAATLPNYAARQTLLADSEAASSAFLPSFNLDAVSFEPRLASSSTGSSIFNGASASVATSDELRAAANVASVKAPKLKGKGNRGTRIDPSLLGFQ